MKGNDQYLVKVDGTGRLTLRNRRYLRIFEQPFSLKNVSQSDRQQMFHSAEPQNRTAVEREQDALPADIPAPHYAGSGPPDNSPGEMVDEPTMETEDDAPRDAMGDASDDARGALINGDQGALTKRPSMRMRGPGRPRKRVSYHFTQKHSSSDTPIADGGPQ